MDDLTAFISARLDEDEAMALAAGGDGDDALAAEWRPDDPVRREGHILDGNGDPVVYDEGSPSGLQAAHIARHDPARVLREVAAKRAILSDHMPDEYGCQICQGSTRCPLESLAAIWSDHPDYRDEWRVSAAD